MNYLIKNKKESHRCWLSLGSNYEAFTNIKKAHQFLSSFFKKIEYSSLMKTKPIGLHNPSEFINQVAYLTTTYSKKEIIESLKNIERQMGRTRKDAENEIVRIDIDLLIFNDQKLKEKDLKRMYICKGIEEIKTRMKELKFVGVIPARYASTRFPAKPLAILGGKQVIQHVYEQASKVLNDVYVATDDQRTVDAVEAFGGKVVMTSTSHKSGTDRCREAIDKIGEEFDVIINIQGDEPFVQPSQLKTLIACFDDLETQIATLVKPFNEKSTWEDLHNPNTPKVVLDKDNFALYFSRSVIPYMRGEDKKDWLKKHIYLKHIGLYAYRLEVLKEITALPQSPLEIVESLEQLRWLENGYKIKVGTTDIETIGIDTPEDLQKAELFLERMIKK